MNSNVISFEAIPSHTQLLQIAELAQASHLKLMHKDDKYVLCSIVPDGWTEVPHQAKPALSEAA
jgi:hypothetical protein